jgi:hypothetical protein
MKVIMNEQDLPHKDRKLRISRSTAGNLELQTECWSQLRDKADETTAIVKVAESGYVPQGIKVRAQIAPKMFTAKMLKSDLERLRQDPLVVSIGAAKPLRPL